MNFRSRLGKFLFASLIAATCAADAGAQRAPDATRAAWGFDRSDLVPHPGVRFGVLPNGMRYALMRGQAPAGGLSVRLRIDAGSTVESAREHGFMHLLEHLVFHGSANLPNGVVSLMLAHQGLKRWSDFNAFTGYDETVYRLDLSRSDRGARETALMVMREISSHLRFDRKIVEAARKLAREEIRARDAMQDRIIDAQHAFFLPGTPIARGSFAGGDASLGRASGAALRRLYDRYYVPARSTLVLVGDFEPAVVEAEIAARFSDWRAGTTVGPDPPRPAVVTSPGVKAHLFVDPAAPTRITVAAVKPLGASDAGAPRDVAFLEHLGVQMLNRRLARSVAAGDAHFLDASAAIYDHLATARMARMDIAAKDRDWRRALQAAALALREVMEHGFSQSELEAQLTASRSALAGDAATRTNSALADAVIDAVGRKIVFTAPADASAAAAYLARVRLADVNAAFRAAWANPDWRIFVSHDSQVASGETAVTAAWSENLHQAVSAPDPD